MSKKENTSKSVSNVKVFWFSVAASVLLLFTNSAIWVNQQIFNTENFTNTVTTSLTSDSSREAIAQGITDKMFEDRPVVNRVAGNFTTKVISGILATDQFENLLGTAVQKLQVYATSSNQEDVAIQLGGVKDVINQVTGIATNLGQQTNIDVENIPDEILIVKANDIPDFYKYGIVFMWMAPITLIGALVLLGYPYIKKGRNSKVYLMIQGSAVVIIGLFGLLIGPLFKPPLLAQVNTQNARTVIGNIYDAFISTFNQQISVMILFGVFITLIGVAWYGYPIAKNTFNKKNFKTS